jgi:DNA-binding beta-propeller fold protein YncE
MFLPAWNAPRRMPVRKPLVAALCACALVAAAAHERRTHIGSLALSVGRGPVISGSRIPLSLTGASGGVRYSLLGPGSISGGVFTAPQVASAVSTTILAAAQGALAYSRISIVPPPPASRPLLAVASYDNGIALHDPKTFDLLGYAGIGGAPADVTFSPSGDILTMDTDAETMLRITRAPWQVQWISGVPLGNEIAFDATNGDTFVSNRDTGGFGALTRVDREGAVRRTITGQTAEGLALDRARGVVYVGNVNDSSVAEVDARTMRILRKIRSVPRTFGIALDGARQRLFVVSNVDADMRLGAGHVAAIDLRGARTRIVARSADMPFPVGVVRDAASHRLFVTDEAADVVYVLSDRTLRPLQRPLATCRTPWRPSIAHGRLYVPCARSNAIDVFGLRSLRRVRGAPFATGGFPISVAIWP